MVIAVKKAGSQMVLTVQRAASMLSFKHQVSFVDTRNLNVVDRPEDFQELVDQLQKPIKGTQYYVPLGNAAGD